MNRKTFLSALAAIAASPFIHKDNPKNELPRDKCITPADVEAYVKKEIESQSTFNIRGKDLYAIIKRYQEGG